MMIEDDHESYWTCPFCDNCQLPDCIIHETCHVVIGELGGKTYHIGDHDQ